MALKRPAWQSSLMIWSGVPYPAYKATDGSMETNHYVQPSCAHTLIELNPWLAIDLGVPIYVNGVDVTSRGDCNHCGAYAVFAIQCEKRGRFSYLQGITSSVGNDLKSFDLKS